MRQMLSIKLKSNLWLRRRLRRSSSKRDGPKLSKSIRLKSSLRMSNFRLRRLMKFSIRRRKLEFRLRRISKLSSIPKCLL